MKRRTIVEIVTALKDQDTRPTVWIDSTKGAEITFGLKVAAPSLKLARQRAVEEFKQLVKDIDEMKSEKLVREMGHGRA